MQLLCRIDTPDYAAWRRAFDDDAEERGRAGLTLLQLWREADAENRVAALFQVNDRDRAAAYLATAAELGSGLGDCTFLRTA